jgi:hypothetical protein
MEPEGGIPVAAIDDRSVTEADGSDVRPPVTQPPGVLRGVRELPERQVMARAGSGVPA